MVTRREEANLKLTDKAVAEIIRPAGRPQFVVWDSELTGFGVVVGAQRRTFIAEARVHGKKRRVSIGALGKIRDDRRPWTTTLARQRAKEILGDMAGGIVPCASADDSTADREQSHVPAAPTGPTLRDAMNAHIARMRKKRRSERSIQTLEWELGKHLAESLDRPLAELAGPALVELHDRIKAQTRPRRGSNPANATGAPLANRIIRHVSACWNSLNKKLEGRLGSWNPAKAVDADVLKPKRERIAEENMPDWWARVQTLSPVRRDMHLFCLFTAMRSKAARLVRWEHVDLDQLSLSVPAPKGGEAKAFRLPIGPTLVELFKRRRRENAIEFAPYGGDAGYVFPSLTRAKPYRVQPIAEAKERRKNPATGRREKYLSGPHTSRRTYLSVAAEEKISELDRSVLANHAFGSQSVNQTYIEQHFDHLLECQTRIERGLLARLGAHTGAPAGAPTAQDASHASTSALS